MRPAAAVDRAFRKYGHLGSTSKLQDVWKGWHEQLRAMLYAHLFRRVASRCATLRSVLHPERVIKCC